MALITKQISEVLTEVRDTLQDKQKSRWTDQELHRYLDQAMRNIALRTKYLHKIQIIEVGDDAHILADSDLYDLDYEAIDFAEFQSEQSFNIMTSSQIEFPFNQEETVVVDYYAYPARVIYGVTTEINIDQDLYEAITFFILYRAYAKEDTTENFKKSEYFNKEYRDHLKLAGGRWSGNIDDNTPFKMDFYT